MKKINEYSVNFNNLVRDVKRMPLVLFVGAGINEPMVPRWNTLLEELLGPVTDKILALYGGDSGIRASLLEKLRNYSEYEKASLAKSVLGNQYFLYLRSILYRKFNARHPSGPDFHPKKLATFKGNTPAFLRAVVDLCKNKRVRAIVSYNYDDILEKAVNNMTARKAFNICGPKAKDAHYEGDLPIYYVHGYIPNTGKLPSLDDSSVVLSRDEYFRIMLEPYSWQTTAQLHFLQNYVSLFLGTSLTDWNMMRMLSTARNYSVLNSVYCIARNSKKKSIKEDKALFILNRIKATLLADLGVKVIMTEDDEFSSIHNAVYLLKKMIGKKK